MIDQLVLDLQELDYLRDLTDADSAIIQAQSSQLDAMNQAINNRDSLISIHELTQEHYEGRISELDRERKWWKWGGISVAGLLILAHILQ